MRKLFLIKGLPGSGKSSFAEKMTASLELSDHDTRIFTTDDFFMIGDQYVFDGSLIQLAHQWNLARTVLAMRKGIDAIFVPNTFTKAWECKTYYDMAKKFEYVFTILEPDTSWANNVDELVKKNVHNVPREVIEKMLNNRQTIGEIMNELTKEN